MAFDTYMSFVKATDKTALDGESQVSGDAFKNDTLAKSSPAMTPGKVFEIDDFSFDIEQVLNIGSQSSGAGAGKVTFNPFQITRKTDRASPTFFMMCCAGQHFSNVALCLRRAGGDTSTSGTTFLRFDFALVAVKTISWSGSDGDEAPKEEYQQQDEKGGAKGGVISGSWNRVNNTSSFADITAT
jgi:type VI secretion system secreted protein Hcp